MYLYEYVNRCIAIHTYDYNKPEKNPLEWHFFGLLLYVIKPNPRKSYVRYA